MSTAGKVLSILVIIPLIGWIVLMSAVTQLNKEWSASIIALRKQVDGGEAAPGAAPGGLVGQVAKLQADVDRLKDEIGLQQTKKDRDLAVIRSELADVQKVETDTKETLLRLQLQVAGRQTDAKKAEAARELRVKEKDETIKALDAARGSVEELKVAVGAQFDELGKLRERFQQVLTENQRWLRDLRGKAPAAASSAPGRIRRTELASPGR